MVGLGLQDGVEPRTMASVAPSTDQRVMSPLCSFSAPAPAPADSRNVSPPPDPDAAIAKVLLGEQMLGRRLRSHLGSGSGSNDGVRRSLVATRDIRGSSTRMSFCPWTGVSIRVCILRAYCFGPLINTARVSISIFHLPFSFFNVLRKF